MTTDSVVLSTAVNVGAADMASSSPSLSTKAPALLAPARMEPSSSITSPSALTTVSALTVTSPPTRSVDKAIPPFIKEMKAMYPSVDFVTAKSAEEATKGSDIIITCTPSSTPFIKGEWLKKGAHVSAIGADVAAKRELETSVLNKANKLVVDFIPQAFVVGDFAKPKEEGAVSEKDIYAEMGEIVSGQKKGRTSPDEITLFKATGLAIEDVGTGAKVYELAVKKKIGTELPN